MSAAPHAALDDDLALLCAAAKKGGALAMRWFGKPFEVFEKSPNNPVTEADLQIDALLRDHLGTARPDYGWLSEETKDDGSHQNAARSFVVDPIDGTRAFIKGLPFFTVALAIIEKGKVICGAVYNPVHDELYAARLGGGARLNGAPIHVSEKDTLEGCKMLAPQDLFLQKKWRNHWPTMHCGQCNSMAYRMVLVASGAWDATVTLKTKSDWDIAGADLIAREAGACVTAPSGQAFVYGRSETTKPGVICAGPALHALIKQRIDHYWNT